MSRVTLRQVAQAAGVSQMTVSNIVNGRFDIVHPDTRGRVEAAIDALGYRPEATARGLRSKRTMTVGMLIIDPTPTFMTDPLIAKVVAGLSRTLSAQGYGCLLEGLPPSEIERSIFIRHARVDGLCVFLSGGDDERRVILDRLARLREPIVAFQETIDSFSEDHCRVRQDDYGGASMIAGHLLERGARRILLLVPDTLWPAVIQREQGVRDALVSSGEPFELSRLCCGSGDYRDTQAALERHLAGSPLPDAMFANNDQIGIAAMRLALARGIRIPEDLMITGFNGFEFWQYTTPSLTTALSPADELGPIAATQMLARIETGAFGSRDIVRPVELRVAGSTLRR